MEDIHALLRAVEDRLRDAEEILAKINLEAVVETLTSCREVIERHQAVQKSLLDRKSDLLRDLSRVVVVVKKGGYDVTHEGRSVNYISQWAGTERPFAISSYGRAGPEQVAADDLYWPVVEDYIGVVQTAVREASNPSISQEAERTKKVIQAVVALAEGLKR